MKKVLLIAAGLIAFTGIQFAQVVIEDFEHIPLNQLSNEPFLNEDLVVVDNPDPDAVNGSTKVMKFTRSQAGAIWAGFWSQPNSPVDMTDYKYVTVKVWKPRITEVKFKVEGGTTDPTFFELPSVSPQTKTDEWEQLTFHFPNATGEYARIAMLLDFVDPVGLSEDIDIYVDEIVLWTAETGGDSMLVEDFETIALNQLSNDPFTDEDFQVITNPDPDEVNGSANVLYFKRSMAGAPWAGFWSSIPQKVDMTNNKYILAKVWKPRTSVVKFKVEGGTTTPSFFELESVEPQADTNAWEQLVFHFPDATGEYPTIAMLLDFVDPVNLEADMDIYVDDIILSPTATGIPTAIKEPGAIEALIYPNPVNAQLTISNARSIRKVVVTSLVGQQILVAENPQSDEVVLNVSGLNRGLYLVTLHDSNGATSTRKIMKE